MDPYSIDTLKDIKDALDDLNDEELEAMHAEVEKRMQQTRVVRTAVKHFKEAAPSYILTQLKQGPRGFRRLNTSIGLMHPDVPKTVLEETMDEILCALRNAGNIVLTNEYYCLPPFAADTPDAAITKTLLQELRAIRFFTPESAAHSLSCSIEHPELGVTYDQAHAVITTLLEQNVLTVSSRGFLCIV